MMPAEPRQNEATLQVLCDIIGDTGTGPTGSEICLSACGISDTHPGITKRHRLFEALRAKQEEDRYANGVLAFIEHVMDPVRYVDKGKRRSSRNASSSAIASMSLTRPAGRLR